jgi:hypothetical protein
MRLTDAEKASLDGAVEASGESRSDLMRRLLLRHLVDIGKLDLSARTRPRNRSANISG